MPATEPFKETTTPLLRPNQVEDMTDEKNRLEASISGPAHISGQIQNRGDIVRQLRSLARQLDTQSPQKYVGKELDAAVKREQKLREEFVVGMPTQEEMRRNPTGVVDKLIAWEGRHKDKILEWKNIRLRLFKSEALPSDIGPRDVANLERYRPTGGAQQLNMDNEQIPGASFHLPDRIDGSVAVMTDEDAEIIKSFDTNLFVKMALMSNEDRARVLEFARALQATGGPATEEELAVVDAADAVDEESAEPEGLGLASQPAEESGDDVIATVGVGIPADLSTLPWGAPEGQMSILSVAASLGIKSHGKKRVAIESLINEKRNE